jgi:hypothetical protein
MLRVSVKGGGRLYAGVAAHEGDPRILWLGAQELRTTVHWTTGHLAQVNVLLATVFEMAARIGHVLAREFDEVGYDQQVGVDVAIPGRVCSENEDKVEHSIGKVS